METLDLLREFKVFDYAIFDLIVSFGGIYLLAPRLSKLFLKIKIDIPRKSWLLLTLPIGIIFHLIFGNITPMTRDLINPNDFYLLKILMLILIFFGFKYIKLGKK
ncbi:MAG: hypothetical protein Q9M94_07160 [Candidatus Gracilibacteria bacterium]|nr:hypothetical protein [Candidatus Gracilibacteria bacterium]MDQ7023732.1 hypothetical protein [Candidatus Gracilibacteria bacterium]